MLEQGQTFGLVKLSFRTTELTKDVFNPNVNYCQIVQRVCTLLTLGAHAPEGYGSCPVCVTVRNLNLGTGASRGLNEGTNE